MPGQIRTPVFAANWKMHHGPREARRFVERFLADYPVRSDRTVILSPPAVSIEAVAAALAGDARADIRVGVQNIFTEPKGAFTGETSAPMAVDAGASFAIVGHSERRHVFGETDDEVARKCAIAVEHGLVPILCVGERLEQRESGTTESVVLSQLRAGIRGLSTESIRGILVAYEPVWAIGTGKNATPDDAAAVHGVIRAVLADAIGVDRSHADSIPILYGGSVNATNAKPLLAAHNVNGLLVGGASLDPAGWAAICST
jgi:triosephosphate isomerase